MTGEFTDAPLVEDATMKLAALAGISVAAKQVVRLSGLHAVAMRRIASSFTFDLPIDESK